MTDARQATPKIFDVTRMAGGLKYGHRIEADNHRAAAETVARGPLTLQSESIDRSFWNDREYGALILVDRVLSAEVQE